jgi:hypothetical protein
LHSCYSLYSSIANSPVQQQRQMLSTLAVNYQSVLQAAATLKKQNEAIQAELPKQAPLNERIAMR